MGFVVFKGEAKVADLVSRIFGELDAADAKRAQSALLRANPSLAKLSKVPDGALLVVPPVAGIRPAQGRTEAPAVEAVNEVRVQLEAYRGQLGKAAAAESQALKDASALLGSEELKQPNVVQAAAPYVAKIGGAIALRFADNDQRAAWLDNVLGKALKDLDDLAQRSG